MANENVGTCFTELVLDSKRFAASLKGIEGETLKSSSLMEKNLQTGPNAAISSLQLKFKQLAMYAAAAFSVYAIKAYAQEATMLTARLETMNIVLGIIGKNAGYSSGEMKDYVEQVKKMGITTDAAQNSLTKMAQANLNLSSAARLARVAQDAAVIGNTNSSAAFERLVYGIKTAQTEVLRTIGINVSFESSYARYAASINKTTGALNEQEKMEARLQAVMAEGIKIQGAYEAAMQTTGKLINSLPRYFEEVKEKVGELFSPALGVVIRGLIEWLQELGQTLEKLSKSGDLAVWAKSFSDGLSMVFKGMKDFSSAVVWVVKEIYNLKNVMVETAIIAGFIALGGALTGVITLSVPFAGACTVIATAIYGIAAALATVNPVYAAFLLASLAVTGAWMAWKRSMSGTKEVIYDSEEAMTRFNAKVSQMKFKPIDPDINKQIAKEMKEHANILGITIDEITKKEENAIRKRVEGFYEGAKATEQYKKRLEELDKLKTTSKAGEIAKQQEQDDIKNFMARLSFQNYLAKEQAEEAIKQKERIAKKLEDDTKAANAKKVADQEDDSRMAIMKSKYADLADTRKQIFEKEQAISKSLGISEMKLAQDRHNFAITMAKDQREQSIKEMNIIAATQEKNLMGAFNRSAFISKETQLIDEKYNTSVRTAGLEILKSEITNREQNLRNAAEYYKSINEYSNESYRAQITLIEEAAKKYSDIEQRRNVIAIETRKLGDNLRKGQLSAISDYYSSIDQYSEISHTAQLDQWWIEAREIEKLTEKRITAAMYVAQKEKKYSENKLTATLQTQLAYYNAVDQYSEDSFKVQKDLWVAEGELQEIASGNKIKMADYVSQKLKEYEENKNQAILSSASSVYDSITGMEQESADLKIRLLEIGKQKRIDLLAKEIGPIKAVALVEQQIIKQTADIRFKDAEKFRNIKDAEISKQISLLDLAVAEGALYSDTLQKRIDLTKELIVNQEIFLSKMTKSIDPAGYLAQEEKLANLRKSFAGFVREQESRTVFGGVKSAMNDLAEKWTNIGQQMKDITTKMFQGMEDALVSFVRTGKIDFRSLAESIINDMIRMAIQAQITGPLMKAAGSSGGLLDMLGNLLGGGGGASPYDSGAGMGGWWATPHTGGIIGVDTFPTRFASSDVFLNAPRAHVGIGPGEKAIIAKDNESIMTPGQRKDFYKLAREEDGKKKRGEEDSSPKSVKVEIINESGQKMQATNSNVRFDAQEMIVTVWLDALNRNAYGLRTAMGG